MRRTCARAIPSGRIKRAHGFIFGVALSAAGFAELWYGTNALAAWLGLSTLLAYMLAYTPMKRRSSACTTVGARRVLLASVCYLPVLLAAMLLDSL